LSIAHELARRIVKALDEFFMALRAAAVVRAVVVDERGEMRSIISLAIALIIASAIMPVALTNLASVNTSGWDPTAKTLWPLLSIFAVLGVVLIFLKYVTKK